MQKILAIDDKQDNLVVIKALLRNLLPDTLVFTAQSGQEGLEIAQQESPDVILLDLVMPGMNGYEVCKNLKAEETTTHIPIIILTAIKTDSQSRVKALNSGADAFLTKPIDEAELVAQVNAMLRIKRAEDKLRQEKDLLEELVRERTKELQHELEERKRIEEALRESKERLLKAQHVARMGFLDWNLKTNEMYWSDEIYDLFGIDPQKEKSNIDLTMQLVHSDDLEFVQKNLDMAIKGVKRYDIDHRKLRPDGKVIWVHAQAELVRDADGNPESLLGTVVDITDRKHAEEQIRKALEERIILLREIHHRTRNNMQIMSTLLGFQANQIEDEHVLQLFRDAQQRINAMALVHQKLHREDLTTVNLQEYIPDLVRTLLMSYSRNPGRIALNLDDIEPVLMTIDTAIPFSLVLNELISNVLKHAFPNDRSGEMSIRLHATEEGVKDLWVCDDGVGLPDDFDAEDTESTGLWLIKTIIESQLHGSVEFETVDRETAVHIRFKEPYYEKRI